MRHTTRTFIAIDINKAVRAAAVDLIRRLREKFDDIKWVEGENLHFTLKFLGEIPTNELYDVTKAVQKAMDGVDPFDVDVVSLGAFPSIQKPRTIWLGVEEGAEEMTVLFDRLETELQKLGYPREGRSFTPHLTLGRAKRGTRPSSILSGILEEYADAGFGRTSVDEVAVYSSELDRHGPKYDIVGRARL